MAHPSRVMALLVAAVSATSVSAQNPVGVEEPSAKAAAYQVEEVFVTANKREQNVQDIVGGIQVFSGENLDLTGAAGMEDYILQVPGAGYKKEGNGTTNVAIRGISNITQVFNGLGDGVSTVGLYLNDVPVRGGASLPDLGLYDLSRIEVLKGPQGTLYGEGAMGGAIRMILNAPSLQEWSIKGDVTRSKTRGGDDNSKLRVALGGPVIEDRLGLRLVATGAEDSGYVDYVRRGEDNADDESSRSYRAQLTWAATEKLSADLLVMKQRNDIDNFHEMDLEFGDLQNGRVEDQFNETEFSLAGLTLSYDFGFATLTSVTGKFRNDRENQTRSALVSGLVQTNFDSFGELGDLLVLLSESIFEEEYQFFTTEQESRSQELRLVSNGDEWIDWVLGIYASETDTASFQRQYSPDMPLEEDVIVADGIEEFEQVSLYGEVNIELLKSVELTLGYRVFEEENTVYQAAETKGALGLAVTASGQPNPTITDNQSEAKEKLPKASLSWQITDNHLVYALASKGFRSGGNNLASQFHGLTSYEPDTLWNYELGAKTSWFDGRLIVNASVYELDWDNTQAVALVQGNIGGVPAEFIAIQNVGAATVEGGELEFIAQPFSALTINGSVGKNTSEIESTDPTGTIVPGNPLPNQPELTSALGIQFVQHLFGEVSLLARVDYTYTGEQNHLAITRDAMGRINDGDPAPAYELYNARLGLESNSWGVTLFIDNIRDERPILSRNPLLEGDEDLSFSTSRPRTAGITVRYSY